MGVRHTLFPVLTVFLVLVVNLPLQAISISQIDRVRNKGVLDNEDLQIIDDFVGQAVRELTEIRDFTFVAKARTVILSRAGSSKRSAAEQYDQQFSESAYRYISDGLEQAEKLAPEDRRFKAIVNLLILVNGLEDVRLIELARARLNDENTVIRYWAVRCVTNPSLIEHLNSGGADNLTLASEIAEQLKGLVEGAGPEIIALMVRFAAELNIDQAEDLLCRIADMRIKRYTDWSVEYELVDGAILNRLSSLVTRDSSDERRETRHDFGQRFGQLYSYAIQRYVKGRDFLTAAEKGRLASVLVGTEKTCIGKLLGVPQSVIKRTVERDDYIGLLAEHSRLLGDETRAGKVPLRLNFDYGERPDGGRRTAPLALPQPPE